MALITLHLPLLMRIVPYTQQVRFPASLDSRQRACLHAAAEHNGLAHRSDGPDDRRVLTLGLEGAAVQVIQALLTQA